jgi:hypothetical protein
VFVSSRSCPLPKIFFAEEHCIFRYKGAGTVSWGRNATKRSVPRQRPVRFRQLTHFVGPLFQNSLTFVACKARLHGVPGLKWLLQFSQEVDEHERSSSTDAERTNFHGESVLGSKARA